MGKTDAKTGGIGMIPFFNDFKVYEGLKIISTQRKQRIQAIVLEALQKRYSETAKKELTVNNAAVLHSEITERLKSGGGVFANIKTVPEYIEMACKEYVRDYFRNLTT